MKNIIATFMILTVTSLGVSAVNAGQIAVGVSGSYATINATGTEADKDGATDLSAEGVTSLREANATNRTMIGSVFAEYTFDNGLAIGVDHIPGSADVSDKSLSRTDVTADAKEVQGQDDGARTANAEVENHMTYYVNVPIHAGTYALLGYVEMDVNTTETNLATASYGNTSVDGYKVGAGYRGTMGSNLYYKLEGAHTEFDTLNISNTETVKGNKISADLDVTQMTFAVGYAF